MSPRLVRVSAVALVVAALAACTPRFEDEPAPTPLPNQTSQEAPTRG